jgi:hypothetical protein
VRVRGSPSPWPAWRAPTAAPGRPAVGHELLQLLALVGRQRVHQRLGGRHLLAHLLEQLVERLRRIVAEHVAELLHELVELRILTGDLLHQHVVQRLEHVLHAADVAVGQVPDHVLDVPEERVGHALAQLVQQLEELLLRIGIDELVLLEGANLRRQIAGQVVELLRVVAGDVLQHLVGEVAFRVFVEPLADALPLHVRISSSRSRNPSKMLPRS